MAEPFDLTHIRTNGVTLRAAVAGEGPLVILVHGFPELWYSWRHQIGPIADAGYRVVAPDMRGYGGSDKPHAVTAYDMRSLTGDIVGLIDACGAERAILIGHDWGAPICWNTAALYPERIAAIAGLSVPHRQRGPISNIALWRKLHAGKFFYQVYFQDEGVAEAEFEADVRGALRRIYYWGAGEAPAFDTRPDMPPGARMFEGIDDPDPFPAWLTEADLDYYTAAFEAGGFRGPLNRYRNQDRDWEDLPELSDLKIVPPSFFIAGSKDIVRFFMPGRDAYADPGAHCLDFRGKLIIDGKGHWIQQEAPTEVTQALLEFLRTLRHGAGPVV